MKNPVLKVVAASFVLFSSYVPALSYSGHVIYIDAGAASRTAAAVKTTMLASAVPGSTQVIDKAAVNRSRELKARLEALGIRVD